MTLCMLLLTGWRPVQCLCNINHVDNNRLNSISFAFNLDQRQKDKQPKSKKSLHRILKFQHGEGGFSSTAVKALKIFTSWYLGNQTGHLVAIELV